MSEASSEETPYGRHITSDGWFLLNLGDALALLNDERGGAMYPLESRERALRRLRCPGRGPRARRHAEWPGAYVPVRLPWPLGSDAAPPTTG